MREFLLIFLMAISIFAAGGDTLEYDAGVEAVADGDTMFVDIWYHPLKDSIQSIINGRLGNINLAADANIALTKLDTSTTITKLKADTIGGSPYIESSLTTPRVNTDSLINNPVLIDSINTINGINVNSGLFRVDGGGKKVFITGPADDTEIFNIRTNSKTLASFSGADIVLNGDNETVSTQIRGKGRNFVKFDAAAVPNTAAFNNGNDTVNVVISGDTKPNLFKTHAVGDSVTVDGGFSALTFNSGLGVTELYVQDQGVKTTDTVTFDTLTITNGLKVGSFSVESASYDTITVANNMVLNGNSLTYDTGSFTATLTGCTTSPTGVIKWTKIGPLVTLIIPSITGVSNSSAATLTGLPTNLRMNSGNHYHWCPLMNDGVVVIGSINIQADSVIALGVNIYDVFVASGNKGVWNSQVTYSTN